MDHVAVFVDHEADSPRSNWSAEARLGSVRLAFPPREHCSHDEVTITETDSGWVGVLCDNCPYAFSVLPVVLP